MRKQNRPLLRVMTTILCVLLVFLTASGSSYYSEAQDTFGNMFRYNGFVFGDFAGLQADAEGALAIGGSGVFGGDKEGFDVAGTAHHVNGEDSVYIGVTYPASDSYPALVIGGGASVASTGGRVYGGHIAMKESVKDDYESASQQLANSYGVIYYNDAFISDYFAANHRLARAMSGSLADGSETTVTAGEAFALTSGQVAALDTATTLGLPKTLVITIQSDGGHFNIGEVNLPVQLDAYDLVIFNILSDTASFSGGSITHGPWPPTIINTSAPRNSPDNDLLKEYAQKLVWNFPNATSVTVDGYGVVGAVIAPNAAVVGDGGSINGRLICYSLVQDNGMELHNFSLNMSDKLLDLPEEPDESSEDESSEEESSEEESSKDESSEEESSKDESSEEESSKDESSEEESSKDESSEEESSKEESSKDESSKDESSEEESSKEESSKDESSKDESSEEESSKNESSEEESSKDESSEEESSKDESSKDESSKDESSKDESSKEESSEVSLGSSGGTSSSGNKGGGSSGGTNRPDPPTTFPLPDTSVPAGDTDPPQEVDPPVIDTMNPNTGATGAAPVAFSGLCAMLAVLLKRLGRGTMGPK